MFADAIVIGIRNGLLWLPLVLGIGLLYAKLREIDVSVDGVAILSGLAAAATWNETGSYVLSFGASIAGGAALSGLVSVMAWRLRLGFMMAGIVFSLGAGAVSVLLVGESLSAAGSRLLPGFRSLPWWLPVATVSMGVMLELMLLTRFGIALRRVGDGAVLNSARDPAGLRTHGAMIAGAGYGLTAALIVHAEGVARSGGGFDFLLIGLSSYLCAAHLMEFVGRRFVRARPEAGRAPAVARGWRRIAIEAWGWTASHALAGSVFFHVLIFAIVLRTPNPAAWKIVLAGGLLLVLTRPAWPRARPAERAPGGARCYVRNLHCSYDTGTELRPVLIGANADFPTGISLVRGVNGAGKSTLLRILAGVLPPRQDSTVYPGQPEMCYLLPQRIVETVSPSLTVYENIAAALPPGTTPLVPEVRTVAGHLREALVADGLAGSRLHGTGATTSPAPFSAEDPIWLKPCRDLSGGQALMVAVFCAYVSAKPVILMDEPSTGLDEPNFRRLAALLGGLARHRVVVVTSHDNRLVEISDRVLTLEGGQLLAQ